MHCKSSPPTRSLLLLALLLLLLWPGTCTTDISLQNCPSQYNLSLASETTPAAVSLSTQFYAGFASQNDNDRIQEIITSGDKSALRAYMLEKIVPFAIVGGVILAVILLLLYYCLFDKSFPPCESLRRNPLQKPYTLTERRCMAYSLLLLAGMVFAAGIVSFTAIPHMKTSVEYTKCAMYNLIDMGLNGDLEQGWGGFQALRDKIGNISSLLDSAGTQIGTYFNANDQNLLSTMLQMKNKNIEIYTKNQNAVYLSPNPTTALQSIANNGPYPTVDSVFIKTGMGPNGTFNTMVDDIDRSLRATEVKSAQAYQIKVAALSLVDATATIKSNAVAAQNTLAMYLRQINVVKNQTDTFSQQFFNGYFTTGIYVLQAVVGFVLVSSLLVLIGGLSTHFYQIFQCRYMVHCGWFLYSLMYFGVLVLAFVTLGMGTVGYYSCQYFRQAMTNDSSFSQLGAKYSQNVLNRLDVCLLGDGNVLKKFNINNQMITVTDVFTNISKYFDYDNPSSTNYINPELSTTKIQQWIEAMDKYRLGVYFDSRDQQRNDDNPNFSLGQMNTFTNPSTGSICSRDRWVYDVANCSTNTSVEIIYRSDNTIENGKKISYPNNTVICISMNQKLISTNQFSWSAADLIERYLQIRESCPSVYNNIMRYGSTLVRFRDSRLAIFQGIRDQLQELYAINTGFNTLMVGYRQKINQFYQSVATLNNIISNQVSGLLVTSNCKTLSTTSQAFYNIFCVNFMAEVAKVAICTLLLLIIMLGGMIMGALFGVRYANVQMLARVQGVQEDDQAGAEITASEKILADKDGVYSERSHSSEEEDNPREAKEAKARK